LKLAFPLSCPIFTLIALVVAFRFKASNLTFELGMALAFALAFFAMTAALSKMGAGEAIPYWIAAWGPALIFGGLSLSAFFAMRTDYS
jgi:lipopolysaccharide export LptBFGC system permease protein LptF